MRTVNRVLTAITLTAILSACGGGGGGGGQGTQPTPTPVTPPPVAPPQTTTFTVEGTITASSSQAVDSDTNDPTRVAIPNDTLATAQQIGNPITVGGYVNRPDTGADGRSSITGDSEDFFAVRLLAGQSITMLVADFERADADLYLYNEAGDIVDSSIETGNIESMIAPADGNFFINVQAFGGATNYILAIGTTALATAAPRYDIVPYEAIVKYHDALSSKDADRTETQLQRSHGLAKRAGVRGRPQLLALRRAHLQAQQDAKRLGSAAHKRANIKNPALLERWETLITIKNLNNAPQVEYAQPNYRVRSLATPNDPAFPAQWHYPLISLPDAWETTAGNSNVVVAVIDTGILGDHPDLQGQLVDGFDFISDVDNARDGDGLDNNPFDPGGEIGGSSSGFHGTHVAGTVAASGNNGRGGTGVAYAARIMPLRALGSDGSGTTYDVDQAVRYAAGLENDSGRLPSRPADIINLSLGGGPFIPSEQALMDEVRAAGVIVVAAAGNEATASPGYPAAYRGVISVSALDSQRQLAPYSNFGTTIDISAPGGDSSVDINGDGYPDGVLSTSGSVTSAGELNYTYAFASGTSMAAPHVAGVIALMKSVNPDLTPDDIDAMLSTGQLTEELGPAGRDNQFGFGMVNAQRAVFAALAAMGTSPADNPRLTSSTATLNFGTSTTQLELLLRNGGLGELNLVSLEASEPWVQITPTQTEDNGLGTYRISVDRDALSPGVYSANIRAQSSTNSLSVSVLVSVGAPGASADVGVIYILLYDPVKDQSVAQLFSGGVGPNYNFRFTGIEAGDYQIIAGSDADNDLEICDAGEACGAWLTTDQPITIEVKEDIANLDFPVEFLVSIPSAPSSQSLGSTSSNTYQRKSVDRVIAR